jgi:GNAT superfamily N-acetyltransferase
VTPSEIVLDARRFVLRAATLDEIVALRHRELRAGHPREAAVFEGDTEPTTRHWGAFDADSGACVGCATLVARPFGADPALQLRGMATRADLTRRGIGAALLALVHAAAGDRLLWCNARLRAVAFYRRLGWEVVSDVFDIPDVGLHRVMVRRLGSFAGSEPPL